MSTSKLDAIRELLKTQEEKHVIQAVWAAYGLTEAEAIRMVKQAQGIDTTVKGYPDPFILATEWLCVEQGRADGIPLTCAPELKANNHHTTSPSIIPLPVYGRMSWNHLLEKHIDGRACIIFDAANQMVWSEMYQPFAELSNDKTDRAC